MGGYCSGVIMSMMVVAYYEYDAMCCWNNNAITEFGRRSSELAF